MAHFTVKSDYSPAGDQPKAIDDIVSSIKEGNQYQTLLGVTGSGKTYTMAKTIEKTGLPTLIMTHNKTLAAQLYSEFTNFFPDAHVEYFVSYYDYYQPEAYIPRTDLFIEKDSAINDELERMRLSTTTSLLNYDDVIVIASVSANYGLGDPEEYSKMVQLLEVGGEISQRTLLRRLVDMGYIRNDTFFDRGNIRVQGDVVDIYPTYNNEEAIRIEFFGDEIEAIYSFDMVNNKQIESYDKTTIFATNQFIVGQERLAKAIEQIEIELEDRLLHYAQEDNMVAYQRLKQRVEFDLEMLTATGACKGVENYSRHLTGKAPGETPNTLLDYFDVRHKDYLVIVDESHVSLPQYRGMYAADKSRKEVLVEYGFRLPSAMDNRPFKFEEYIKKAPHYLFVSATPNDIELDLSSVVAEQIVRPTGLLDPPIEIRPIANQVEDIYDEIKRVIQNDERVLITTLTKKMSEALAKYLSDLGIKVAYLHSDIDTIERTQIIRELRLGKHDVLIGINLLREGLDIPEVSRVAILDADKEGFLRSETALIQTMGRAARNAGGKVIMYADRITKSIQKALDVTEYRREKQMQYNKEHGITPTTVKRILDQDLKVEDAGELYSKMEKANKIPPAERKIMMKELSAKMKEAAKNLEFEEAARLRDQIAKLRKL